MSDTQYSPADKKKLIILRRAVKEHPRDSVQGTVRFLLPRVPQDAIEEKLSDEWYKARCWWERLTIEDQNRLNIEYKFAAKIC